MGVGFEFEIGCNVKRIRNAPGPYSTVIESDFPKYHVLFRATGWNLECDPPGLEFVVKPPVDESAPGRATLVRIMDEINSMCVALEALHRTTGKHTIELHDVYSLLNVHVGIWVEWNFRMKPTAA